MRLSRRHILTGAAGGLALLAGCATGSSDDGPGGGGGSDGGTTFESATQVPTTGDGVTIAVTNDGFQIHTVRVTGIGDDTSSTSLPPGGTSEIGALQAPGEGEISYQLEVYVDGESVGERDVAVAADTDLTRVEITVSSDGASWNEVRGTPGSDG